MIPEKIDQSIEEMLGRPHSMIVQENGFESRKGDSMGGERVVEISGIDAQGSSITFLKRKHLVQGTGVVTPLYKVQTYCSVCDAFSSESPLPCKACGLSTCPSCRRTLGDGSVYHKKCLQKKQRKELLLAVLGLPFRFFVRVHREE